MKNNNTYITSSKITLGFVLLALFITTACSNVHTARQPLATTTVKPNSDILVGPGECMLQKFEGTSVNNKFYLYWVFKSNSNRFLFEIESSVNGKKFKPCGFKPGVVSPGTSALMLCMVDSTTKNDVVYYRIKAIGENYTAKTEQENHVLYEALTIMIAKNKKTHGYMQDEPVLGNQLLTTPN